jgi:hypothetical protein
VNFNQAFVKDPVEGVDPEDPDGLPGATLSDVADHIDHIKKVAGIECAGEPPLNRVIRLSNSCPTTVDSNSDVFELLNS